MNLDWHTIMMNDLDWEYFIEITLRTLIMFVFVLVFLRLSGKKGVRQLSLFEVAIIIALGSAAGDPMFNKDTAILPSLLVFVVILIVYRAITFFAARSERIESLLEGEPMYIIEDGQFTLNEESDNTFAKDEFFAEMRAQSIEHLGQVKTALLETNGQVSFFYHENDEVKPGLPILPKPYSIKSDQVTEAGDYACTYCGKVQHINGPMQCSRCQHKEWVKAIKTLRIT